nr:DUF5011 domain-containing protein [Lachnospiraceae bacterium]
MSLPGTSRKKLTEGSGPKIESSRKTVAVIILGVIAVLSVSLAIASESLKGAQLWREMTIELGETLSTDPADYLIAYDCILRHSAVDLSGFKSLKAGDYTVKAGNLFGAFEYTVHVRDTIAPEILIDYTLDTVLESGKEYDLDVLGVKAMDLSGKTFIHYYYNDQEIDSLYFDDIGRPEIVVEASDINANRTKKSIRLFVDTPPRLYGVHEQYVLKGSGKDALDPVFARDDADGLLISDIEEDISEIDFNSTGDYVIGYKVRDSYGLEGTAKTTVHVVSSPETVKKHYNDVSLSKEDLEELVDYGYFTYEPKETADSKWVVDTCAPTLVNLYWEDEETTSSGSGFIFDITPEYVYVVSVYHVTSFFDGKPTKITFYDGSNVTVTFKSIRLGAGNEASLIRIPVSEIPYHTMIRLKEVAYDQNIYDDIKVGTDLIEYCKNWRAGLKPEIIKYVKVISFTLSDIQKKYVDDDEYFAVTRASENGMSGTAIFDERGWLSGICSKTMLPFDEEETRFRNGCDFLLMVDKLPELM